MPRDCSLSDSGIRWPRNPPHDVVAIGNDLSLPVLLSAYRNGIFPWPIDEENPICWFSPRRRGILEYEQLRIGRTLRKTLRRGWRVSIDHDFERVITECAKPREQGGGTWIVPEMIAAYLDLHEAGFAHSVEVWKEEELVGGLYGVDPGGSFSGESMFSRVPSASKVALVHLMEHLHERGLDWIDVQMMTPHIESMGARAVARLVFLDRLDEALQESRTLF